MNERRQIGQIMIEQGLVNQDEVQKALQIQASVGGRLGGILVRTGALSEDSLMEVLSFQLGLPVAGRDVALPDDFTLYEFLRQSEVDIDWFIDESVLLWQADGGKLYCSSKDPLDNLLQESVRYFYPDSSVDFLLTRNQDIDRLLSFVRRERAVDALFSSDDNKRQLKELAEQAPVIELVNNIFSQAVDVGASDIHVEPGEEEFTVRLRVDGILRSQLSQPLDRFPAVASRIKLISGIDIAERRLPQDGRITTRVSGREFDVRVSTAPEVNGESIVMRLLPKERESLSLEGLGMAQDHLDLMREWSKESHGIVLVTGPTGSGKSTTLYAMLEEANTGDKKIITVEDPVEYKVRGVTQIQAHAEIGYTFSKALRAILRQDPDTIMIGEIRDLETAEIAIQSALTGHLVLSTLHTNDALSAFTRLIDMGIEPFLVAAPLRAVQAQRLVRRVCSVCAVPAEAVPEPAEAISKLPAAGGDWVTAVGCKSCHGTGYRGRLGIYEMVRVTPAIQALIAKNASVDEIRCIAEKQGFRSLLQDGLLKASKGLTTVEEVLRVVNH